MAEIDPGYGPPPGQPNGQARGGGVPFDDLAKRYMSGLDAANSDDPAFAAGVDATDANTRARAKLIYRDLPIVTIQNTWSIQQARQAVYSHLIGLFFQSGFLCDSILGDDRVSSTLNSRASALFGRPVCFKAANDSAAAKECLIAWSNWWPRLSGDSAIRETQDYATMMGFAHDQLVWDRTQPGLSFGAPMMRPWHPVNEYYDWTLRKYMAIGQDGVVPIVGGNGKWVEHAPYGSYRGWIRGALRPVVEPWMLRHFGFRDMARFGEVHGNPTRKGYVPMVGDPAERAKFEQSLASLGADTALIVPRGVEINDGTGYDYELVEATSKAWEVHPAQIDRCDLAIVLALLMVNITTQADGGSYGAVKAMMDVRSEGACIDNQSWKKTLYEQIARPFAYLNFGDANLAPWTWYDVTSRDEYKSNATQLYTFGQGVEVLRRGGVEFTDAEEVRSWAECTFGLAGMPKFKIVEPVKADPPKGDEGGVGGAAKPKPGQLAPKKKAADDDE